MTSTIESHFTWKSLNWYSRKWLISGSMKKATLYNIESIGTTHISKILHRQKGFRKSSTQYLFVVIILDNTFIILYCCGCGKPANLNQLHPTWASHIQRRRLVERVYRISAQISWITQNNFPYTHKQSHITYGYDSLDGSAVRSTKASHWREIIYTEKINDQ